MRRSPLAFGTLAVFAGTIAVHSASADLTGRWLLERGGFSPPEIATVTDSGGMLTFSVPSIPLTLTGTVSGRTFGVSATTTPPCGIGINGQLFPARHDSSRGSC